MQKFCLERKLLRTATNKTKFAQTPSPQVGWGLKLGWLGRHKWRLFLKMSVAGLANVLNSYIGRGGIHDSQPTSFYKTLLIQKQKDFGLYLSRV